MMICFRTRYSALFLMVILSCEDEYSTQSTTADGGFDTEQVVGEQQNIRDADSDGYGTGDCNDSDPTVYRRALLDKDGDGFFYYNNYYAVDDVVACIGDTIPPNLIPLPEYNWQALPLRDCNDDDPEQFEFVCVDNDQDGYCGSHEDGDLHCVGSQIPIGFVQYDFQRTWVDDCDDEDSAVQLLLYPDNDADGILAEGPTTCVSHEESNEEFVNDYYREGDFDCNDTDSSVAQYHPDLLGDAVDSNCDPSEFWTTNDCTIEDGGCFLAQFSSACTGVDIEISEVYPTTVCDEYGELRIANFGSSPFDSTILVKYNKGFGSGGSTFDYDELETSPNLMARDFYLDIYLESGQEVEMIFNKYVAELSITPLLFDDCDLSNNTMEVPFLEILCE